MAREIISRERKSGKGDKSLLPWDTPLRAGVLTGPCRMCTGKLTEPGRVRTRKVAGPNVLSTTKRDNIDYKTIMVTDEDPLRGLMFY